MLKEKTKWRACKLIVARMCRAGHMNGCFGDIGPSYRLYQTNWIYMLPPMQLQNWFEQNRQNLKRDCGITMEILRIAGDSFPEKTRTDLYDRNPTVTPVH